MARRDFAPSLMMVLILLGATAVCLGMPDWALVNQFLIQGNATALAAVAVVSVLLWVVVLIIGIIVVAAGARASANDAQLLVRRWMRAVMLVLAGVLVLGMGTVRHVSSGYNMCASCGTQPTHIEEVLHLVGSR